MALSAVAATKAFSDAVGPLEEIFGQRVRLSIVACLVAAGRLSFLELKQELALTDGNLSCHLSSLERKGFVVLEKGFRGKKPYTEVSITDGGQCAFERYVQALEQWVSALGAKK